MRLWTLTAREVRYRPGRTALTLLSVVIGVGALVAVDLAMTTTRSGYKKMFEALTGRAALEVVSDGASGFDQKVTKTLEQSPLVEAAVPVMQRPTNLYFAGKKARVVAMGIDPKQDQRAREYELKEGKFFGGRNDILLEEGFAANLGARVGDRVRLLSRGGLKTRKIAGLLAARGVAGFARGSAVFLPLDDAQRTFARPGQVDAIHLVLRDDVNAKKAAEEIQKLLPVGLQVREPATRTKLAEETLLSAEQGLTMAGNLSLVLAMFIILNTFLMNVSERRRQFSIMRAIGATRSQIMRLLLTEGMLVGVVGTGLGILAGFGGASMLTRAMAQLLQSPLPPAHLELLPCLKGAALGIGAALIATYIPARRAGRVSPLEGMGVLAAEDISALFPRLTIIGLALLAVGGTTLALSIMQRVSISLAVPAGSMVLIAIVLLIPNILGPVSRAAASIMFRLAPVEGQLAQRQVLRRRVCAMLTIGVLFIAISTGIGLGTTILNNTDDVYQWLERTIVGDFFLRAMMPDMATGMAADIPDEVKGELAKIPGIDHISTVRFVSSRVGSLPVVIIAKQFSDKDRLPLDLKEGDADDVRRGLFRGEVVLGTMLAQRSKLKPGQQIKLRTPKGVRGFRIAGITNEYTVGGLALYMERGIAERVLGVTGVDAYIIRARKGALSSVEQELTKIKDKHGLMLQSLAGIRRLVDGMLLGVVGGLWILLALGFVVAAFGMVNTLTMNVLEQTRELALLRAVAMTRRQVRRTVLLQAALMGLIGLAPGTVIGAGMAYLMNLGTDPIFGHAIRFKIYPTVLLGSFLVAYLIVLVAAFLPARRAAQVDLMTALQYS